MQWAMDNVREPVRTIVREAELAACA